jgi:L-lactate dehydrogenase complex protein LldG
MSTERDQVLSRVRAALAPLPQRAARPDWEAELVKLRLAQPTTDAWELFAKRFAAVNGTPLATLADLAALAAKQGWSRGYCDPALFPLVRTVFPASIAIETTYDRTRVDDYAFGITRAAGAIAETGTLILTDAGTSSRLAALAPWAHIAVLRRADIFPDISAALVALPADPNIIWVTGPSKTADVEGILIEGVHGPGVQAALLVE